VNKHVRSYEPDLPLPGSGVARELSLLETKSPRRVVWHFAIFLSSYTYKGHGPPKSFCGPPIGNQCLMLNERWHVRFLWSFTQTLHRISKLSIDNSVPQGQKGCDVPDTKFSGASIGQDKAHAALYLRTRFHLFYMPQISVCFSSKHLQLKNKNSVVQLLLLQVRESQNSRRALTA